MSVPQLTDEDVRTDQSTRQAKLKWVIVVDEELPAGRAVNAAACMAAAVGRAMPELLGPDGTDGSGAGHPGLPWAGCSILAAGPEALRELRAKAAGKDDLYLVDMPGQAQTSRVYDEYLDSLAGTKTEDLDYLALSIVGPRNKVSKLIGKLPLLR
ncbi:DUF2000 domain-containing protein [Streptomyces antimycoticus]|uniref:DUF2000 domain-containing protein n=4 Tax=Streptomyces TaxID=1883 RepID=A0ABD5J1R0_9ACTN|nr:MULTISPECIES: DUF2000 domain-containing protein [Streptomyces]MEE4581643.1 DUF2000 domain-containing protein [Streptomyces sp. DSM 41602]KUL59913.1 hypothetical protein ADL28_17240 [Streptomyces violaceusniger]QTI89992.1 DUF2000 domain-containing protein [Streptomyces sp. AgN23]WJD95399.1 DUF2000 domain-containing protein [Streptomyces antimycoticus]WTA85816.1 DUF2000 domain-containing protein [Streptomyces antimycoticus]